ncbi:hypothetical protein M758_4G189600 [Ceratodon purpureus]|nr:hypothetical protein M758_4G189600 [Ceratodon purpureus]KAG0620105.1 hypothetical protein M758_4G189600 [Ceratodon purpureus]
MAPAFAIPSSLRDLEATVDNGERLCVQEVTDVENLSAYEVDELVKGVAYELAENEVWSIEEQSIFDQVYSLVRGYSFLEPSARGTLVESLCSNFSVLNPSISTISHASSETSEDAAYMLQQMHSHRNALKIYSYFLHCILVVEEAADVEPVTKAPSGKGKKVQPRKAHVPAKWNWEFHRTRIIRLLATALQVDLRQLYSMSQPENNLIAFFAKAAFSLLENPSHVKEKDLKDALCNIVAACAAKYGYIVPVTSTILNLLHKYEHLSVYLAELVALAEEKYHNSSLSVAVLREIGHINPDDFKRDNSGADSVSSFLVAMAERLPKLMTGNLSIITPHLDGESYKMRNGIVQVIGTLIVKTSKDPSVDAAGDEMARLRNKQGMVDILLERARDKSSYTRSKVLQTWANLCMESAVSIGHWNLVAQVAAGRLEDKAAIVRKGALQLLTTLLQFNPFGPRLRIGPFEGTLQHYKDKLRQLELATTTTDETVDHLAEPLDGVRVGRNTASEQGNSDVVHETADSQHDNTDPSQIQPELHTPPATEIGGLEQTRTIVASLESGLQFARYIAGVMDVLQQLLASPSSDDVKHTITLLILARQFEVDGAEESLRKMLPLVFSQEKSVYEAVEGAFTSLYMKRSPSETALNLLTLALDASIGDLASIEALLIKFTGKGDISHGTVAALWNYFTFNALDVTPEKSRGALVILCMAAKSQPRIISSHLQSVIDVGLGRRAGKDPLLARYACIALQRLSDADRIGLGSNHKIFSILSSLIIKPGLPEEGWYSAAEQAINAIYSLHPTPEKFASGLLLIFCKSVFGHFYKGADEPSSLEEPSTPDSGVPRSPATVESDGLEPTASHLSRFLFALAHIALKHLVYVESCVRKLRKQRADKEKAAADAAADLVANNGGRSPSQHASNKAKVDSIDAELGLAASEDARIDSLLEKTESEIIFGESNKRFLIGAMAPIVAKTCRNLSLMQQYPGLRSSAMLALCKLMAIDADFCDQNLQLLFTVAQSSGEAAVRSNCIIALGDLAFRFPNVLEPWTEHMYARLNDKDRKVRKNAVLVLTHLILNDMVKVKGHISEMVLRLEDEDERIQNLVKLFFHELSNKGNNPIYNLLPDILSRLSNHNDLPQDTFRSVMQFLINSITKDKQKEGLFEKLCHRFPGTSDAKQWKDLSYCMAQLTFTDKSLKKMIELFPKYQNALGEEEVVEHFRSIVAKALKFAKPEVKAMADDFETRVAKFHEERKEHDLAMQNAQAHQSRPDERIDGAHTQDDGHMGGENFEEECEASRSNEDERNEDSSITEDVAASDTDHLQAQVFSEEKLSEGGTQQSIVDSHDLDVALQPASTNNQESDSGSEVSRIRSRSLETSAVLADKMSDDKSDSASDSEIVSESASAAIDMDDEFEDDTQKQQSPDPTNLQHVQHKKSSCTRKSQRKRTQSRG